MSHWPTLEFLADIATETPVLVIADDVHWLDESTAAALSFIGRRLSAEPIGLISAQRATGEHPAVAAIPQLLLAPLGDGAARHLLDLVAPDLGSADRDRVLKSADGNPLALLELPTTLHRSGPLPEWTPVGDLVVASFTARMSELPAPTRWLLLASALATGVSLGLLVEAARRAAAGAVAASDVQPAVEAGFVTVDGDAVGFGHRLMASAVYQSSPVGDRLAMHAALACTLSVGDERQVWHAAAATVGRDDEVAARLEAAAAHSVRRGSLTAASVALERAADLWRDDARQVDALLAAGGHAAESGDAARADRLADRVAQRAHLDAGSRARLLLLQEGASPLTGTQGSTVADLTAAALAVGDEDAEVADALIWAAASRCHWRSVGMDERRLVVETADRLGFSGDVPRRIASLTYVVGDDRRTALYADLCSVRADPEDLAGLRSLAMAAENLGDHARAATYFGAAATAARRAGALGLVARLQSLQAWATVWSGSLDDVAVIAADTERLAEEVSQPMWHGAALLLLDLVTGFGGDYPAARGRLHATLASTQNKDVRVFHTMALYGLAVAALGAEHYDDAYAYLRQLIDADSEVSHYRARQWVVADIAEAALATGRRSETGDLITGLIDEFRDHPTPAVRFAAGFAEVLWADDGYDRAVTADSGGGDFVGARAGVAYGGWLRRHRRPQEARTVLTEAHATLSRLGMVDFADRAARELRAVGGPDVRGRNSTTLTPQELQIAQLAAQGLSNRQIGERLFLSHRTVGSHLYRIFPKLNISARSQLARALHPPIAPSR